jgi:hypothetical protein
MKVIRIDYYKNKKYNRLWIEAENIEEAMVKTGIETGIVDYCKIEIKEV